MTKKDESIIGLLKSIDSRLATLQLEARQQEKERRQRENANLNVEFHVEPKLPTEADYAAGHAATVISSWPFDDFDWLRKQMLAATALQSAVIELVIRDFRQRGFRLRYGSGSGRVVEMLTGALISFTGPSAAGRIARAANADGLILLLNGRVA